jgi:hypothetical protein
MYVGNQLMKSKSSKSLFSNSTYVRVGTYK